MNIQDIKNMTASERIQTMEAIWDSLIYENKDIETPAWHEEIIENRKKRIKSGNAQFISLSDLKTKYNK